MGIFISMLPMVALFVLVDILNEWLSAGRNGWTYTFRRGMQTALGFAVALPCFVWFVNFMAAVKREADPVRIPADWSAGVMNHGTYYRWYTIQERPYFFAASLTGFVISVIFLIRMRLRIEKERKQRAR